MVTLYQEIVSWRRKVPSYKGHNVECLTATKKKIIDDATKPYDAFSDGPFKDVLTKSEDVFRKEITNYFMKDGCLYKEVSIRDFTEDKRDYHDTTSVQMVMKVK